MKHLKTIIIFIFIIINTSFTQFQNSPVNKNFNEVKFFEFYKFDSKSKDSDLDNKFELWKLKSFLRGANIHPYKLFSPFSMNYPISRGDLIELKILGANVVVANYPGVFTYFPPYVVDTFHLRNLDRIVELTSDLKLNLIISIRSGPGRSLYTFFDKIREDEFVLVDSTAKSKYIEMCRFIVDRYKNYQNLVGVNFFLEPHSDDPVNISAIDDSTYFEFIEQLIDEVRNVDKSLPIIVQPMGWAYPDRFSTMKKFDDDKIVYSFDMYFPHSFTNEKNDSSYPGFFFVKDSLVYVDSNYLRNFLKPVIKFKEKYDVPIFVNEYGGIRSKKGFIQYLKDLHQIFQENGFHFAYYVWKSEWGELDGNIFDDYNYEKGSERENSKNSVNELIEEFKKVWNINR